MLQVIAENYFGLDGANPEGNVFADKTFDVSANTTDVLSANTFPSDFAHPDRNGFRP